MFRSVSSRKVGLLRMRYLQGLSRHYAPTSSATTTVEAPMALRQLTAFSSGRLLSDHHIHQRWRSRSFHNTKGLFGNVVPFNLPDVGEAIMTVEVKEWLVKPRDRVSLGDAVCEVQSDKSAVTIYVPYDGVVKELMYEVDDIATKGKPLMLIEVEGDVEIDENSEAEMTPSSSPTVAADVLTTPAVRRMANELNINLNEVQGSGKDGRILKEDLVTHVESQTDPSSSSSSSESNGEGEALIAAGSSGKVLATPAVRRVAREWGMSLSDVKGTGESGRVLKEDILRHVEAIKASAVAPPPKPTPVQPTPVSPSPAAPVTPLTEDRTVPVKGFKAVMVRTMTASGQVPQFGYILLSQSA